MLPICKQHLKQNIQIRILYINILPIEKQL